MDIWAKLVQTQRRNLLTKGERFLLGKYLGRKSRERLAEWILNEKDEQNEFSLLEKRIDNVEEESSGSVLCKMALIIMPISKDRCLD